MLDIKSIKHKPPGVSGGACVVACVCIGAGMLGLPTAGAGAWTLWSIGILLLTYFAMIASGCLILEALQDYPRKSSFTAVTMDVLGKPAMILNNSMVYFVGGILLYAYTTSAGLLIHEYAGIDNKLASILFVLIFSGVVWHSTTTVSRISILLMIVMGGTFLASIMGLLNSVSLPTLIGDKLISNEQILMALPLIPIAVTSFGYHHTVASLRAHYSDERKTQKAIVFGVSMALVTYVIWLIAIYGNLPRSGFSSVVAEGGNIDALLKAISEFVKTDTISSFITFFSTAAILSSFIGVGLGIFDFLADLFKFEDTKKGRGKTLAVTFLPPLLMSLLFPFGFLDAIGFAAIAAAVWICITPTILVKKLRDTNAHETDSDLDKNSRYRVMGGSFLLVFVFVFGVSVIVIHTMSLLNYFPSFN